MPKHPIKNLDGLQVFAAVAEAESFTAAADKLGMTKASVSLQIARLESLLGVTLLTRTTRRVRMTEAGQSLFEQSAPALHALRTAMAQVGQRDVALKGTLRLTAPVEHFAQSLAPAVTAFAARHPELRLELHTSDQVADLVKEGIDLAIRLGALRDSTLRAVRLGTFEQQVVAAPAYLRRHGIPGQPEQLADHDWVTLTLMRTPLTWTFTSAGGTATSVRMKSRVRVDSSTSLRALLLCGAGLSVLPDYSIQDDIASGRLIRVLPRWTLPNGGIYAVLPPGRHTPVAAQAFIEFYRQHLGQSSVPSYP